MLLLQARPLELGYAPVGPGAVLSPLLFPHLVQQFLLQRSSVAFRAPESQPPPPLGVGDVTTYYGGLEKAAELMGHSVKPATQKARDKAVVQFQSWLDKIVKVCFILEAVQ